MRVWGGVGRYELVLHLLLLGAYSVQPALFFSSGVYVVFSPNLVFNFFFIFIFLNFTT